MYVDRTGSGVVAYINNNGFLDNPTFRGMRWNLMRSFDKIYVLNLHGNSQKKETAPNGGKDENVFDIMVGTSINIFVKTGKKGKEDLADFMCPKNDDGKETYDLGFSVEELFNKNVMGIVSMGDSFAYAESLRGIRDRLNEFLSTDYSESQLKEKYSLGKNYAGFVLGSKRSGLRVDDSKFTLVSYRPFDERWTYYDGKILWRAREDVLRHMLHDNIGICAIRINSRDNEPTFFISDKIIDKTLLSSKDNANIFPLYLYSSEDIENRVPNLNPVIWNRINDSIGRDTSPEEILDYIYGILYSADYREKYKEFLKVDFPRVPYPSNAEQFQMIAEKGNELIGFHLMKDADHWPISVTFPENGDNIIGNVSAIAWNAYIGGYQPAQKWLKDRKGRSINFQDILHYGRILYALEQTDRIMKEIDEIGVV